MKETGVRRWPLGHFAERSLVGLIVLIVCGTGAGLLLLLVRAGWGPLRDLDEGVAVGLNAAIAGNEVLVAILNFITDLGARWVLTAVTAVAVVALLIRRQGRLAIYLIVTGLGSVVIGPSLKLLVGRLRPVVDVSLTEFSGNSFPSGHALGATVTYGSLLLVFLPAVAPRWRKTAIALVALLVAAIGLTRILLGAHFVSDVVAGWLLGVAWLVVTGYAFRLWRRERGRPVGDLTEWLEPEAAPEVKPAPDEERMLEHPRAAIAELVTGWVLIAGVLFGFGLLVTDHAEGTFLGMLDREVPLWFATHGTPFWDDVSWWASRIGDTESIIGVAVLFCPLMLALWRRWRPVFFLAATMVGEVTLFLVTTRTVARLRPPVENLDGAMPTSSFPSGHVAASLCLYIAIAILVMPRTDRWWRWISVVAAVVLPLAVALSRLYRGMHHPGDLLGSGLLTLFWIGLLYWVVRPNADLAEGNQPTLESEDADRLDDELIKTARHG